MNILILKPCCLGDVLMTTPLVGTLRAAYPEARIDYAVGEWARPAVATSPDIDEVLPRQAGGNDILENLSLPAVLDRGASTLVGHGVHLGLLASLLFGGVGSMGLVFQGLGWSTAAQAYLWSTAPYVLTLVIMIATSSRARAMAGAPLELSRVR